MAIIRNAANTLMKGRVGQTTYYISKGQQVARQSRNDSNYGETARRTELQQNRRVLWSNLVQFYKISARWMPKAFESKRSGQTDYNKFMAVNVPSSRIPLTKSQAEAGACIVDGFLVSQGSLPSIETSPYGSGWKSNLLIGNLTIAATTTVADLTTALLANNANIRAGMQLSFASYQQNVDPLGTPRVNCRLYEITLSESDTSLAWDHIPELGLSSVDGCIGTASEVPVGGFAWIISELANGALKVSTQLLVVNNSVLIGQYTTTAQLNAAAQSYGIDTEVILNPSTTVQQGQEPTANYIQYITVDGVRYYAGDYIGAVSTLYGKTITVTCSESLDGSMFTAQLFKRNSQGTLVPKNLTPGTSSGTSYDFTGNFDQADSQIVVNITITVSTTEVLTIEFAYTNPDIG